MDKADGIKHPSEVMMPRVMTYYPWLLWEIIKSNIDIAKIIIHPNLQIQPQIFKIDASQASDVGIAIYANSITLTPGTITVGVVDNRFEIHALTQSSADGLNTGEMDARVRALEKRGLVRFDNYNAVDEMPLDDKEVKT